MFSSFAKLFLQASNQYHTQSRTREEGQWKKEGTFVREICLFNFSKRVCEVVKC